MNIVMSSLRRHLKIISLNDNHPLMPSDTSCRSMHDHPGQGEPEVPCQSFEGPCHLGERLAVLVLDLSFPRIGNKNLNFTKSLAFSFLVFERMPDFKSFEHNLWGFWQNEKMIKRPRNIYYLAGMSYTLISICQRMVTSFSVGLRQRLCLILNILQKWFSLLYQLTLFYVNKR